MPRLAAFALLALSAFALVPPFLDRAGTALLGLAFLAIATPRARRSLPSRIAPKPRAPIALPTADAGQTTESLLALALEQARAGVSTETRATE